MHVMEYKCLNTCDNVFVATANFGLKYEILHPQNILSIQYAMVSTSPLSD